MNRLENRFSTWRQRLNRAGITNAANEVDLLLETYCGISKTMRLTHPDLLLTEDQIGQIQRLIARREAGEPLQYLLGCWFFYGRRFWVGPGVLIPRADTEILVEQALAQLQGIPSPQVADLCAGSGCVGITVACERPDAQVFLLEVSSQAAAYCKKNKEEWAPRCQMIQADVLCTTAGLEGLDAVLANPPYIPTGDLTHLQQEVQWEPRLALDGSEDGLSFYRQIPLLWNEALKPGGLLAVEIGFDQAQAVCAIFQSCGLVQVRTVQDYSGNDRVVLGRTPGLAPGQIE